MKLIRIAPALQLFILVGSATAAIPGASNLMPEPITNVTLEMPAEDLFKARPNIPHEGMLGAPVDWKAPRFTLYEKFSSGGRFSGASYLIENGKLISVTVVGNPKRGEEAASRREIVREYTAKWGKQYRKRVPKDDIRPGEVVPTLTWEIGNAECLLMLPKNRKKGDSKMNAIALQIRTLKVAKKEPLKESSMSDAEKKTYFEAHDVSDK